MSNNQCYLLGITHLIFKANEILFRTASITDFYSCKAVSSSDMRRIHKALNILHPQSPYCFKPLNLLQVQCSCEMSTFCEVLHEAKQKTLRNSWEGEVEAGKKSMSDLTQKCIGLGWFTDEWINGNGQVKSKHHLANEKHQVPCENKPYFPQNCN